jgi:hypothetical protein
MEVEDGQALILVVAESEKVLGSKTSINQFHGSNPKEITLTMMMKICKRSSSSSRPIVISAKIGVVVAEVGRD